MEKAQDDAFAALVKQKVQEGEVMDEQKKKQLKDQLKNNQNKLKAQMDENVEKARYGILMTEYERRVNDDDIEAYENMDNKIHG